MDFRILGPLEVLSEEGVLDVGGGKQRSVLVLLLLHANEIVSSDRLIEGLWPDEPPPSAAKIVQVHVSRLRKALDGVGDEILLTRGHGYELRVAPGQLDLDRFQGLLEDGRAALAGDNPDKAAETLRNALALWRGPPLADFAYDSFAQGEIARLEELRFAALEERIEADLALGRHDAVVQELGLEPSPTLQQLARAILGHDQVIQTPTRRSARERSRRKGGVLIAAGALVLVAAAISIAVIELTGNRKTAGLTSLAADSVGVIDPDTNRIVGQVPVGSTPTRIAFGRD